MKYRIEISGRGGEVVIGTVKREFYDIVEDQGIDIEDYAYDYDFFEENEVEIPEDVRPFEPGDWYDCDNLAHSCGPNIDDCYVSVLDENDTVIHDAISLEQLLELGAEQEYGEEVYPQEELNDGDVYFLGQSFEKGHFLTYEVVDEAFDPKKVKIEITDFDGWELITGFSYNDESLDDLGDMSTNGKGSNFQLIVVGED